MLKRVDIENQENIKDNRKREEQKEEKENNLKKGTMCYSFSLINLLDV